MTKNSRGFTIIEATVVVAIFAVVALALIKLIRPMMTFFQRSHVTQELNLDGNISMDTMVRTLRQGKATSVSICSCMISGATCAMSACGSPSANSPIPNSHIDFTLDDGNKTYSFYWINKTIEMAYWDTPPGATTPPNRLQILTNNVASVTFSPPNSSDLAIEDVSLIMSAPYGPSGEMASLDLPVQEVHMVATQ